MSLHLRLLFPLLQPLVSLRSVVLLLRQQLLPDRQVLLFLPGPLVHPDHLAVHQALLARSQANGAKNAPSPLEKDCQCSVCQ